jgi:phage shock protein PspC (stress-responsive transcriptional regulator)
MDAAYCPFCGAASGGARGTRRLTRIRESGKIAGVCAGLAAYLNLDVTIVRVAWIVLSIVPGALIGGLLAYAAAWMLMPDGTRTAAAANETERLFRSDSDRKVAGVCGGIARYLRVDSTLVRLTFVVLSIYPGAIILGVIVYVVAWVLTPLEPPASLAHAEAV